MRKSQTKLSVATLSLHVLTGAMLGAGFLLVMVRANIAHFSELVQHAPNPAGSMLVLASAFALMFGVGAGFTGALFSMLDEKS